MAWHAKSDAAQDAQEWLRERAAREARWSREATYCQCGPKRVDGPHYLKQRSCRICGKLARKGA